MYSYGDAQRYRLGINHHQIPVNTPKCPSIITIGMVPCASRVTVEQLYDESNSNGEWRQPDFPSYR
ncbi:MAG: catalase [Sulfuriferula sp.]